MSSSRQKAHAKAFFLLDLQCGRCGANYNLDLHHLKPKARGGPDEAGNIRTICRDCHRFVHENPAQAQEEGWLYPSTAKTERYGCCRCGYSPEGCFVCRAWESLD